MAKKVNGFVRAIVSRDPSHKAPPFVVEIYSPKAKPGERTKRFHLKEVCDNRELVLVSVLRDAMIHSYPVQLNCDDTGCINSVDMRSTTFYEEWKTGTITGKVKMISIDEFGIGKANVENPDIVTIVISKQKSETMLYLNLQRSVRETKIAQLSLIQQAFKNESDVTIKYHKYPMGKGEISKVIIGVQLGKTMIISPEEIRRKIKIPIGKEPEFTINP